MICIENIIKEMSKTGESLSLEDIYKKLEEGGNFSKKYMPGMMIKDYIEDLISIGFLSKKDEKYFVKHLKKNKYLSRKEALNFADKLLDIEENARDNLFITGKKELIDVIYDSFEKAPANIVCLCGSTRFKTAFEEAIKNESLKGNIVLSVAMFGHLEGLDMNSEAKQIFDNLHFKKIELANEILVLNVEGYIGESTKREVDYAISLGKKIRYLENI